MSREKVVIRGEPPHRVRRGRPDADLRPDERAINEQLERLRGHRDGRDPAAVGPALDALGAAARDSSADLMPPILEAVRAYATLGEICGSLREVFSSYRPPIDLTPPASPLARAPRRTVALLRRVPGQVWLVAVLRDDRHRWRLRHHRPTAHHRRHAPRRDLRAAPPQLTAGEALEQPLALDNTSGGVIRAHLPGRRARPGRDPRRHRGALPGARHRAGDRGDGLRGAAERPGGDQPRAPGSSRCAPAPSTSGSSPARTAVRSARR